MSQLYEETFCVTRMGLGAEIMRKDMFVFFISTTGQALYRSSIMLPDTLARAITIIKDTKAVRTNVTVPRKKNVSKSKTILAHESHTDDSVEALSPAFLKLSVQTHRPSDGATALSLSRIISGDSG